MQAIEKSSSSVNIDRIVSTIGELPASPAIVTAIMDLTSDMNSDVSVLGEHVLRDQVLTAKVLKLSNSSFYGRSKKVSNVKDAIIILGFKTIRSLVLASSVRGLFKNMKSNKFEGMLWEHSLSTAIVCRLVAEHLKHPRRDEAFLCGILHDIGKLILFRKFLDQYEELFIESTKSGTDFHQLENEVIGVNHMEVGTALLGKWNFPDELIIAVKNHHDWPEYEEGSLLPLSWMVNYSSLCSSIIGCNIGSDARCETQWVDAADKMEFSLEEATELNNKLFELFTEEKHIYE